jgi:hypothetical protein
MKKLLLIPILLLLLLACAPITIPQITDVVVDTSPTSCNVTWNTDIPTIAAVMLCDEDVGTCQWCESEDCDYGHWYRVQLDPTRHYKITIVASHCGHQSEYEILIPIER